MFRNSFHVLGLLLFASFSAQAQQSLHYESALFTGEVTLAEALPANGTTVIQVLGGSVPPIVTLTAPGPLSYLLTSLPTCPGEAPPTYTTPCAGGTATFTTVNGVITAWDVELDAGGGFFSDSTNYALANASITSANGDTLTSTRVSPAIGCTPNGVICNASVNGTSAAGFWTVSPNNVRVLQCTPTYKVIVPSATAITNVSPNSTGEPSLCAAPNMVPSTYYVKTTTNNGATWQWVDTLGSLGLGN